MTPRAQDAVALAKSADGNFFVTGDDEPAIIAAVAAVPRASEKVESPDRLQPGRSGRFLVGPGGFDVDADPSCLRRRALFGPKPTASHGFDERPRAILHRCRSSIAPICCQRFFSTRVRASRRDSP